MSACFHPYLCGRVAAEWVINMNEKVSIVVPIYNTEKYLNKCLTSIANQTYQDLEVILVNDGSKDGSGQIAASFAQRDSRFVLIEQKNQGVSTARNNGLEHAHGEYILFIDSDDRMDVAMVETLLNNCVKSDADISCCQSDYCARNDLKDFEVWNHDQLVREFLAHKRINGQLTNKLVKRNLIGGARFNTSIKYGEDALFLWHIIKDCSKICITRRVLYYRTLHNDSASGGGFKPIRMQSHMVWQEISQSVKHMNQEYYNLARAQLGNMAFFSWFTMLLAHYDNACYEKECRTIVKENLKYMLVSDFIKRKVKVVALALSFFPTTARLLVMKRYK